MNPYKIKWKNDRLWFYGVNALDYKLSYVAFSYAA